jgi:hypothetical protein
MATIQPQGEAANDPSFGAAPEAETDDGGYVIEIKVDGQGKISVCVENEAGGAPEGVDGGMAPPENEDAEMSQYQPAANIKEALTMALDIFKANGKAAPGDALGKRLGSAGFASGYDEG